MNFSTDIYFPTTETEKLLIKSIWRLQDFYQHKQIEKILPKGTIELIFNLSDKIIYLDHSLESEMNLPHCFINGINFKPIHLIKTGQQVFIGIQLKAIGLKALFDIPAKELNDSVVEGSFIYKPLNDLYKLLFLEKTFENQVFIIRKWLYSRISTSKYFSKIQKIHNWFYFQNINALSVKELSKKANISERQLSRLSIEWLGMNTQTYLLYNKYLSSLHFLHNSELILTQIGLMAGYYDQSHFIREFKSYTNLTPKEYKDSVTGIPGHIHC